MSTKRKNFEQEHLDRLKELTWLFISNNVLIGGGNMGVNKLDANVCLNTLDAASLSVRRINVQKRLVAEGENSAWTMSEGKEIQIEELNLQKEFLFLAEGYVLHREYLNSLDEAELALMLENERLNNTGLTRKQKVKKVQQALEAVRKEKEKIADK